MPARTTGKGLAMTEQYWKDYAHLRTKRVVEALELVEETSIQGRRYLAGDFSVRGEGGVWRNTFIAEYRPEIEWDEPEPISKNDVLHEKIDDLIVDVARIAAAMERYGIANDPDQK